MDQQAALFLITNVFAVLFTFALTVFVRRFAIAQNIMDIPNSRSSHFTTTPRGGGLSILIVYVTMLLVTGDTSRTTLGIACAVLMTGLIGLADDFKSQSANLRLALHTASGLTLSYAIGDLPLLDFGLGIIDFGWMGFIVATIGTIWMINLTNFMDGIDGLVASQATLSSAIILLLVLNQPDPPNHHQLLTTTLLLSCSIGFLALNKPPAKIFMGDVGSGTIGVIFASLILHSAGVSDKWLFIWLIMLGVLVVDATYTLTVRLHSRKNLSVGHRTHAYQKATVLFGSHSKTTLACALISVAWLFPVALLVATSSLNGFYGMAIAYLPLTAICFWLKAGYD